MHLKHLYKPFRETSKENFTTKNYDQFHFYSASVTQNSPGSQLGYRGCVRSAIEGDVRMTGGRSMLIIVTAGKKKQFLTFEVDIPAPTQGL